MKRCSENMQQIYRRILTLRHDCSPVNLLHISMNSFSKITFEVQPDKGNSVVILDEDVYIKNMKSLLSKKAKFEEADTTKGFTKFYCNR